MKAKGYLRIPTYPKSQKHYIPNTIKDALGNMISDQLECQRKGKR